MKKICDYYKCTGCTACMAICPKSCINMESDSYGFLHPHINQEKCINCGLCIKVCPNSNIVEKKYPNIAYAAWSLNNYDRETSTSGGISSVLSSYIIENKGIVYGAAFQNGIVKHIRVTSIKDLHRLKGSKYVQSNMEDIYTKAIHDIESNKLVLFWGTPCQIAGLKSLVTTKRTKNSNNIIYGDIICHGVPSQKILNDHLKKIVKNNVYDISFRDSEGYFLTLKKEKEIIYRKGFPQDKFLNGFQYGLFNRDCCYQCQYAYSHRISDITIGDFWGLGETSYPKKKVSVILCNTLKGQNLIKCVKDKLFLEERPINEAISGNSQLQHPSVKHEFYRLFHRIYPLLGYNVAINLSLTKFYIKHFIFKALYKNNRFQKLYNKKQY